MILALSAIFVGAVTQRIAGMGFAMMVAPFVVLAFGLSRGVVLVNLCGAASRGTHPIVEAILHPAVFDVRSVRRP